MTDPTGSSEGGPGSGPLKFRFSDELMAQLQKDHDLAVARAARPRTGRHLSTQTEYPWRTAIRTGIATAMFFLAAAAAASPLIGPFVDRYLPGAGAGVVAFGVFCGGLALLIKRVGSLPAVATLLVRLGLGVVPRKVLSDD